MARRRSKGTRTRAKQAGYRSGFEHAVAATATEEGISFKYEAVRLSYIGKPRFYKPDFKLKNGILVETKGRFLASDRAKHLLVRMANPNVDIRFVFMQNNFINKGSTTRNSDWCDQHGFKWAMKKIPKGWQDE